jgi:hypothetical protein
VKIMDDERRRMLERTCSENPLLPDRTIARMVGCSRTKVWRYRGGSRGPRLIADKKAILAALLRGLKQEEVAHLTRSSRTTVSEVARANGLGRGQNETEK